MIYEIVDIPEIDGLPASQVIIITREDGSNESFPVDKENLRYKQFLLDLEQEG